MPKQEYIGLYGVCLDGERFGRDQGEVGKLHGVWFDDSKGLVGYCLGIQGVCSLKKVHILHFLFNFEYLV